MKQNKLFACVVESSRNCFTLQVYSSCLFSLDMSPQVQTYHCICTNLILASTLPLTHHRQLDRALILPIPHISPRQAAALAGSSEDDSANDVQMPGSSTITQLIGTSAVDSQACMLIRSDEGIEKRYLLRCNRCRLILGYQLDWEQYAPSKESNAEVQRGRRDDVVYLLEGAVVTTEKMQAGQD